MEMRAAYAVPSLEQVGLMLATADQEEFSLLLCRLLYFGGLRGGEVEGLSWGDLCPEQRMLFIRQGKGSKDRYVLLDPETTRLLVEHGKRFPLGDNTVGNRFRALARECGLYQHFAAKGQVFSPHAFRHAFATHRLERGMDFGLLSRLLGHSLANETVTYTRRARLQLPEVYARCHPLARTRAQEEAALVRPEEEPGPPSFPALREREREFAAQPQAIPFSCLPAVPSAAEVARVLDRAQTRPLVGLFFRLLYVTGLWPQQLLDLQPEQIDRERGRLRFGPLEVRVERASWERLLASLGEGPVFGFGLAEAREFFGQCTADSGLQARFDATGRPLNLEVLRYAFATHCCARNIDPLSLAGMLGTRYHETTEAYFRSAMNRHLPAYDESTTEPHAARA